MRPAVAAYAPARPAAVACAPLLAGALAAVLTFAAPRAPAATQAGRQALPPPVTFTAEQDHSNMMEQLGIQVLRPGASGDENDPDQAN